MDSSLVALLAQFGPAGLIGCLWLYERRSSAVRERQLEEAHRALMARDRQVEMLLTVVKENTRAVSALERSQRHLTELLERWRTGGGAAGGGR